MNRLTPLFRTSVQRTILPVRTTALSLRFTSTSAPKSAEGASAQSGGSRSKTAAENAKSTDTNAMPDSLSDGEMRGRTGGGEPLNASQNAPSPPKVFNSKVPQGKDKGLTEEQQKEVDEHNKDFEAKHDRANPAEDDKVDSEFWGKRDGGKAGA
jgi:hypothetical protein